MRRATFSLAVLGAGLGLTLLAQERQPTHEGRPVGPASRQLMAEHEVILAVVDAIQREADHIRGGSSADDSRVRQMLDFARNFADRCHHAKEEGQLFPAMRARGAGGPLEVFLEEHEEGRRYLRTLATGASAGERATAARRYVAMLHDHIERENEVLFPMADGLLTPEEQGALARAYEDVEREVVGTGGHAGLLATLARLEAALPSAPVTP
jgi:hemerythrin-like domain-containing protein